MYNLAKCRNKYTSCAADALYDLDFYETDDDNCGIRRNQKSLCGIRIGPANESRGGWNGTGKSVMEIRTGIMRELIVACEGAWCRQNEQKR